MLLAGLSVPPTVANLGPLGWQPLGAFSWGTFWSWQISWRSFCVPWGTPGVPSGGSPVPPAVAKAAWHVAEKQKKHSCLHVYVFLLGWGPGGAGHTCGTPLCLIKPSVRNNLLTLRGLACQLLEDAGSCVAADVMS